MEASDTLKQLLNVFWLRPETALWREIDIRTMSAFEMRSPSLDLGCGDGLFSFIRAGGELDVSFDAFRSVSRMDKFFQNVDVFDSYDENQSSAVIKPPKYQIDVGFDCKTNLLKKAGQIGLYGTLKQGDANKPLPFPEASFNSIFSNIIYWLDSPQSVIAEISRVLKPGGTACLMLPNITFPQFSFYKQLYVNGGDDRWRFLEMLDRGRFSDNIRQAKPLDEWQAMFGQAGIRIERHHYHLSKLTIQAWDIGLRPLFPILLEMSRELPPEKRIVIKAKWTEIMRTFIEPLLEIDRTLPGNEDPAFHCFELRK
ncbi:MAG: methyltransferase domain-containing protein [Nitrospira sp.]|nr:methyltransferase domain-containing protein [Nitrospira sp.]